MRIRISGALLVCVVFLAGAAAAQTMSHKAMTSATFGPHPALPACINIAVQDGNPGAGPAVIAALSGFLYYRFKRAGCL